MCGKSFAEQRKEWTQIQLVKYDKPTPYFESVENAKTKPDLHTTAIMKK